MKVFRWGPPNWASNARGFEKSVNFLPISRYTLEIIQDRAIVTMDGE